MADGYEQEDRDIINSSNVSTHSKSAEDIYNELGCEALEG